VLLFVGWCLPPGGGTPSERLSAFNPPPPDMPMDHEDKKMTGVHSGWLTANHNTSPEGDLDAVVQRYALSCVWHMFDE
jgi:hypothetical protein